MNIMPWFPSTELECADEIWITSSSREVLPVTTLNGKPVGHGRPGALFARVYRPYQGYKAQLMRGEQA